MMVISITFLLRSRRIIEPKEIADGIDNAQSPAIRRCRAEADRGLV